MVSPFQATKVERRPGRYFVSEEAPCLMSERGSTESGPPGLDRLTSVALIRSGRVDVSGLPGSSTAVLRLRRVWLGGQVAAAGGPQRGSGVRRAPG